MRPGSRSLVVITVALLGACLPFARSHEEQHQSNVIERAEIERSGAGTAYDLVMTRRPLWLHRRGPQTLLPELDGDVVVYLDGVARLGGRAALHDVATATIGEMRFLDATAANYRFGRGHPYGAIVISTVFPPLVVADSDSTRVDSTRVDSTHTDSTHTDSTHAHLP